MAHSLEEKVGAVARRAFLLRLGYGLAWTVIVVAVAMFICGGADYLVRIRDTGVRIICSFAVLAATVWGVRRFLMPALKQNRSLVPVAQQIEKQFPQLQGRLASSLVFLSQDVEDPTAGSPQLRRAVIAETISAVEHLDLATVCNPSAFRKAAAIATVICAVLLGICVADVASATLAVKRLVAPWMQIEWPRRHHLRFENLPDRLAAGGSFEATFLDTNDSLPEEVTLFFWFDGDDDSAIQRHVIQPLGRTANHRIEHVTRSFQVRASGGDDDSLPWHKVHVVDAPRIVRSAAKIFPPAYTGLPPENAGQQIRALVGSRVEIEATVDKPLVRARFQAETNSRTEAVSRDKASPRESSARVARLSAGGKQIHFPGSEQEPWVIQDSGTFRFELIDQDELAGGEEIRWTVRAIPDAAPTVAIQHPVPQSLLTPNAQVRWKALAKDDLAIRQVALHFSLPQSETADKSDTNTNPTAEETVVLFSGPDQVPAADASAGVSRGTSGESRVVDYVWDLSKVQKLSAGSVIDVAISATDYKPQSGRSPAIRLTIISTDEFEDKIAQRQASILNHLNEILRLERDCRTQTTSLDIQAREAGQFSQRDIDLLQSAELNQRQVRRQIGPEGDGALAQIATLLSDLETNRVANTEVATRMQTLQQELGRLHRDELPVVERELVAAVKIARQATEGAKSNAAADSLAAAGRRQDEVITTLERLLGELSQWDHYRRFAREVARLRRDQDQLQTQTADRLAGKAISKGTDKLSPQEMAELKRLAERQSELTRRLDKLQSQMRKMREELGDTDPLAAQTLSDALDVAQRSAAAGQMRQASQEISQNRIGQAAEMQREASRGLADIENVLANRREQELSRLTKKLSEAAGELSGLRQRQTGLKKKLESTAKIPDENIRRRDLQRLTKEQRQLAEETSRMSRKLQRLQAQRASDATKQAAGKQEQAAGAGEKGDANSALEDAAQAEKGLEDAERQLAEERRQAEADLLREQLVRLEQTLGSLLKRQQSVLAETVRLDRARQDSSQALTAAQQDSVAVLALQQREIATDATALEAGFAQAEAFSLALRGAVREMLRAVMYLDRQETGDATQQAEQNGVTRLEQMLTSLKPDAAGSQSKPPQDGQPQQSPPGQESLRGLAELKLLHLMQQELNRRTAELETRRRSGKPLTADQERELDQLADEQGRLAEMVLKLAKENGS